MTVFLPLNIETIVIAITDVPVAAMLVNQTFVAIYIFEITVP